MTINVIPIPRLIDLAAPAFTLGVANAAGSAATAVASDSTLLAFDTTLPDAITYGQSGAVGSSTTAARRSHAHAMAAEPSVAVTYVGGSTAEATTTSTVAMDLMSFTSLSLGAIQPALLAGVARKTSGAAAIAALGLKLNSTIVIEAPAGINTGIAGFAAVDAVCSASFHGIIAPRVTDYALANYIGLSVAYRATLAADAAGVVPAGSGTSAYPLVEITSVIIRGRAVSDAQTLGVAETHVYGMATS